MLGRASAGRAADSVPASACCVLRAAGPMKALVPFLCQRQVAPITLQPPSFPNSHLITPNPHRPSLRQPPTTPLAAPLMLTA